MSLVSSIVTIEFSKIFSSSKNEKNHDSPCTLRFKVLLDGEERPKTVDMIVTAEFMEESIFFGKTDLEELFKKAPEWFVNLGLIKIEEMINVQSLQKETFISCQDFEQAKKVKEGKLSPLSECVSPNKFQFSPVIPKKEIGFHSLR